MKNSIELKALLEEAKTTAEGLTVAADITAKIEEIKTIKAKIVLAEMEEAEAIKNIEKNGVDIKDMNKGIKDVENKATYEDAFYNALAGRAMTTEQRSSLTNVNNALSSGTGEDGGYLIPADQQVTIKELKRQYINLEDMVTVEPVSTLSGSRNMEKDAQYTPFAEVAEGGTISETDAPKFANITYTIKDRIGILPVPNNLLSDNKANLKAYLNKWLAMKSVATRNKLIVDLLKTKDKTAITDVDSVKTVLNVTLDPAISVMSQVIMNQDSFNKFDQMKDNESKYILQIDPTNATRRLLAGRPVVVVSNKTLPTTVTGEGETEVKTAPVIIGSLKEAIVLFDRQAMSLLATNIGGTAFGLNRTEIRAIEREDVKEFDGKAVVFGEIVV